MCIAVLPAAFGGALPHHADGVQPGNLLLGQHPKPGSPAHSPLGLQPVAQGQIAVRPIPLGHVQMTVGLEIVPGLGVHHVPGSVQAGFQLLKQPAAVLHFVDQFKPGGMDLTFRMMIGVKGGQLVHLLTNGGNGVQILHIVDQIHNHGRAALEGAEGPANLLLIQNGRYGRAAQNHPGQAVHMNALVKHVDAVQQLKMPAFILPERLKGGLGLRAFREHRIQMGRLIHPAKPFRGQSHHFVHVLPIGAEHDVFALPVGQVFFHQAVNPVRLFQPASQLVQIPLRQQPGGPACLAGPAGIQAERL